MMAALRRLAGRSRRLLKRWAASWPRWRRPGFYDHADLENVGRDEALLLEAVRANVNRNDRALYNLLHVFRLVRHLARLADLDLRGKTFLEMGCSREPGLPLVLLLHGCRRYYGNNVLPLDDWLPEAYARLVALLLSSLCDVAPGRLDEIATTADDSQRGRVVRLRADCFVPLAPLPAEDIPLTDGSVDVVFSASVLEHVRRPREVIAACHRLLRPGGHCLHAIDLRDHADFSRPLEFLKWSEDEYQSRTGGPENRVRAGEFLEIFADAGFEILAARLRDTDLKLNGAGTTDLVDLLLTPFEALCPRKSLDEVVPLVDEAQRASFAPTFRDRSLQDLSALGLLVVARKRT
jgi:SAM-dependent methyltransferase